MVSAEGYNKRRAVPVYGVAVKDDAGQRWVECRRWNGEDRGE